ncbi:MAG: hypothetical protein HYY02_11930 [Chloroflexi bacterium]|nr:hypothetical protein [Chloroflexota bacterium]
MSRILVEIKGGILWSVTADEESQVFLFDRDVEELEDFTGFVVVNPRRVQRVINLLGDEHRIELRRL